MAGIGWSTSTLERLPSWVPDYIDSGQNNWRATLPLNSGRHAPDISFDDENHELNLKSYVIDTITKLGAAKEIGPEHEDLGSWLLETQLLFCVSKEKYEAFTRLLIVGQEGGRSDMTLEEFDEHYQAFQSLSPSSSAFGEQVSNMSLLLAHRFTTLVRKMVNGRRLAEMQKEGLGIVPGGAEVGDLICLVAGGRFPFVIRQIVELGPPGEKYQLVRICRIDGLTKVEAKNMGIPIQQITLV